MRPASAAEIAPALWVGAALLAAFLFFPLSGTGFTTNDDLQIATGAACPDVWRCAVTQGRFMFPLTALLWHVPYLVEHPAYFELVRTGSLLLGFVLLGAFVRTAMRSPALGFLSICFALAFAQNTLAHNPLTSYPFIYPVGAILLLASLMAFIAWLDGARWPWLAASCASFFLALSNEALLPYAALFLVLAADGTRPADRRRRIVACAAIGAVVATYLAAYVAFRQLYPTTYGGSAFAAAPDAARSLRVLWQYSISSLPGYYFHSDGGAANYAPLVLSLAPSRYELATVLAELRVEWLAKAMLVFALVAWAFARPHEVPARRLALGLALAASFVFVPNLVISLSPKYQAWVASGDLGYTTTYFSHLAAAAGAALLVALLAAAVGPRTVAGRVLLLVLATAAAYASIVTDFHNHHVARNARSASMKWRSLDAFFATPEFRTLGDGAIVFGPSLFDAGVAVTAADLESYARSRTGRTLRFARDPRWLRALARAAPGRRVYHLGYHQEPLGEDRYLTFSPVSDWRAAAMGVAEDVTLYSFSRNPVVVVSGHVETGSGRAVAINGKRASEHHATAFSERIDEGRGPRVQPGGYRRIVLRHDGGIAIPTLLVSHFAALPALQARVEGHVSFAERPLPPFVAAATGLANPENWGTWSDGRLVSIRFTRPLPDRFRLRLRAGVWGRRNVGAPMTIAAGPARRAATFRGDPFNDPQDVDVTFDLAGEWTNEIRIEVPFPVRAASGQPEIGLGLISLDVEALDDPEIGARP